MGNTHLRKSLRIEHFNERIAAIYIIQEEMETDFGNDGSRKCRGEVQFVFNFSRSFVEQ